jgi:hypothetical protein
MKKLALFLRYQTTYERAFYRALNSLKKLQKDRLASARVGATHASPLDFGHFLVKMFLILFAACCFI